MSFTYAWRTVKVSEYDESKKDLSIFRIESISNATVQDAPAKDYHMVKGASKWQYDLDQYLNAYFRQA